jgi:hypothetical protein
MTTTSARSPVISRLLTVVYLAMSGLLIVGAFSVTRSGIFSIATEPSSSESLMAQLALFVATIVCGTFPLLALVLPLQWRPASAAVYLAAGTTAVASVIELAIFGYVFFIFGWAALQSSWAGAVLFIRPVVYCAPMLGLLIGQIVLARKVCTAPGLTWKMLALVGAFAAGIWGLAQFMR